MAGEALQVRIPHPFVGPRVLRTLMRVAPFVPFMDLAQPTNVEFVFPPGIPNPQVGPIALRQGRSRVMPAITWDDRQPPSDDHFVMPLYARGLGKAQGPPATRVQPYLFYDVQQSPGDTHYVMPQYPLGAPLRVGPAALRMRPFIWWDDRAPVSDDHFIPPTYQRGNRWVGPQAVRTQPSLTWDDRAPDVDTNYAMPIYPHVRTWTGAVALRFMQRTFGPWGIDVATYVPPVTSQGQFMGIIGDGVF